MDANLKFFLTEQPTNVAELARLTGKSQTWVRDNLKKDQDTIRCRKNEAGVNIFWLVPEGEPAQAPEMIDGEETGNTVAPNTDPVAKGYGGTDPEELAGDVRDDESTNTDPADPTPASEPGEAQGLCPLCNSGSVQKPAGEAGSFLGACLVCSDCGKTYNGITGKEVKGAASVTKGKRVILNPQHKIRAKLEATEKVGGSVRFDKTDRLWTVQDAKGNDWTFTAEQFAVETPETLIARFA